MKYLTFLLLATLALVQGCGMAPASPTLLDEISGVWKAQGENTIVTIHTADNRTSFYIDDKPVPVKVGAIDDENKTVNFNVTLPDGTPEIWTIQQIWDQTGQSFHIRATLGAMQADLSFVRKVSVDDLNRLAALSNPKSENSAAVASAAPSAASAAPAQDLPQATSDDVTLAAEPNFEPEIISFAPSFDCAKASNGAERLICSDRSLAEADVQMARVYKDALNCVSDKSLLRREQTAWMSQSRNGCSDSECMLQAYATRNAELQGVCSAQ